jgi:hypothetical protein
MLRSNQTNGDTVSIHDAPTSVRVVILLSLEQAWENNELTTEEYYSATKYVTFQEID